MFSRPMLFFGILVAAVVVPYVLLDEQIGQTSRSQWQRLLGNIEREKNEFTSAWNKAGGAATTAAVSGQAAPPIEQVFRFDLSPQWIAAQWPRVTTVLSNPQQLEMRVVLVTGTRPDDLAGSLTYYFDQHHQLQRIAFVGLTTDPRRLLATVVTPNGLKSQPTTAAARYIAGDPKQPTSEVVVRHLPVLRAGPDRPQMEVSVNLRRANSVAARAVAEREPAANLPDAKLPAAAFRRW